MSDNKACDLCGLDVGSKPFVLNTPEKRFQFCCEGCAGIYEMLHEHQGNYLPEKSIINPRTLERNDHVDRRNDEADAAHDEPGRTHDDQACRYRRHDGSHRFCCRPWPARQRRVSAAPWPCLPLVQRVASRPVSCCSSTRRKLSMACPRSVAWARIWRCIRRKT